MEQRRIYLDTEFHQRTIRGIPSLELISIGMVDNAGKRFYAVSREFNLKAAKANLWLRENVLPALPARKEWQSRAKIREGVLSYLGNGGVQIAYWMIPHDVVLFEQLVSDSVVRLPGNINRVALNLAQIWDGLGRPAILPGQTASEQHHALADAEWLCRVDRALKKYRRGQGPDL